MRHRLLSLIVVAAFTLIGIMPLAAQEAAFPVTIEHQYGSTIIEEVPQRVVSIGYTEQDALLAVGVTPVAVRYWYGEEDAILPWAEDFVEGDAPVVLNMAYGSLNYEAILALQPDLISAVTAGITQEEYDLLSQIAPTITQTADYINFGMPWQDVTRMIGAAVGRSAEAEAVVADVEGMFANARAAHPQFAGRTVAVSYNYNGSTFGFYTAQDARGRFFTELGFVVPEELIETAGELFYADLSAERIDLLDQDLIAIVNLQFIEGGREALEADPLFAQLDAVQDGRVVYFDEMVENAMGFSSPLSLAFALEAAVPQLAAIFPPVETAAASTGCAAGFRLFDHDILATDAVCVPEAPQRVVALDPFSYELLILNGTPPVGAIGYLEAVYRGNFPYLEDRLTGIESVGFPPNPEAILALDPDLIVGSYLSNDEIAQLATIAPTISYTAFGSGDWKRPMALVGDLLGLSELVDDLMIGYQARLDALNATVENAADIEVSIVRITPDQIMLNLVNSFPAVIVTDAGFGRPESQAYSETEAIATYGGAVGAFISLEQIDLVDGDYVFAWSNQANDDENADSDANWDAVQASPLWGTLTAAQNGTAYRVAGHWLGWGIFAAHGIIDDLFTTIAEVDPADVSPNPFLTTAEPTTADFSPIDGFPAFTPTPALVEVVEDRGETLLVRHMMGDTEIPADPQRIYTDASTTQIALSLGLPVVGAQYFTNLLNIPDLAPLLQGVTDLGTNTYQANYEAILAQQPDLIIVWANVATNPEAQSVYDALSQIAPTIVLDGNPFTYWQQATRVLGQLLGREEGAEVLLTDYAARSSEQCERIRAVIGDDTVTIFDVFDGAIRVIGAAATTPDGSVIPPAFTSWAYVDCGLAPGEEVARLTGGGFSASVSLESLGELQADHLIAYANVASPDAEQVYQSFTDSPLWALLPAVQSDQVYLVDVLDASGYYSALYVLERVADAVER
jgi:iron complex transport system substrate-binding protein